MVSQTLKKSCRKHCKIFKMWLYDHFRALCIKGFKVTRNINTTFGFDNSSWTSDIGHDEDGIFFFFLNFLISENIVYKEN